MAVWNSLQHSDVFLIATTYVTTVKDIICKPTCRTRFKLWWNHKNIVH